MSTKERSMRSKVEKRMARETGRTQLELRRAVKLLKKLMTEDDKLIYNLRRLQSLHADPSCIPVVRIEQHVMVVPQHCSSKDFLSDASEPVDTILPPLLRGKSLEKKDSTFNSGHILRCVIFVHGFQINEDRTPGDFKEMGRRLANEVVAFLKRRLDKYSKWEAAKR